LFLQAKQLSKSSIKTAVIIVFFIDILSSLYRNSFSANIAQGKAKSFSLCLPCNDLFVLVAPAGKIIFVLILPALKRSLFQIEHLLIDVA